MSNVFIVFKGKEAEAADKVFLTLAEAQAYSDAYQEGVWHSIASRPWEMTRGEVADNLFAGDQIACEEWMNLMI